jgi:ubiquinone/menaquinone biosynthesis C-methylase UbiE
MSDLKVKSWEESYGRKENYIFYPKEEVVKFLNRFIRKRTGIDSFKEVLRAGQTLKALDFGCGIGRQVVLMEEFGIVGYGVDISSTAIEEARRVYAAMLPGKTIAADTFTVLNSTSLPFPDAYFDFAISDSVLDSMYFGNAKQVVKELDRTVKDFLFISLIAPAGNAKAEEVLVTGTHEQGTVQDYFDETKIEELIRGTQWKMHWMNLTREIVPATGFENARYHIVLKK